MGPFEYLRPLSGDWDGPTEKCGCFNHGENSYFPADTELQQSLCDWQDDVIAALSADGVPVPYDFCRLDLCASKNPNNDQICADIKKYGLDNVPTGNLFNSPYPDTQFDAKLRYPNQPTNTDVDQGTDPDDGSTPPSTACTTFLPFFVLRMTITFMAAIMMVELKY